MLDKITQLVTAYQAKITQSNMLAELDTIYLELFGKSGQITVLPKDFKSLPATELKTIGPAFNQAKQELEQAISQKRHDIKEQAYQKLSEEKWEVKVDSPIKKRQGYLHPITEFENQTAQIFSNLGFKQFEAPLIDTDFNNFEALNIPPDHPARDLWDTLYIDGQSYGFKAGHLLLRTHTSNAQVHVMKAFKPPIKMMNIDRCFRYENLDARHEHTFDQFELIYIDKGLSMANLQYLSEHFLKQIYGPDMKVRLKPKYYPFTEPSAGIDGLCIFCKGQGCKVCGGVGWLELAGAGMIHPQVLKNGGVDPDVYSGIAWGVGPGRMAMLKYDVSDVRLFNSGDLKFLQGLKGDTSES